MRCRRHCSGPGGRPTGSRAAAACARGCTASPPTSAWTWLRSAAAPGAADGPRASPRRRSRRCSATCTRTEVSISPIADVRVLPEHGDPAEIAAERETIRLAFVTALQHLLVKPGSRATLIMCEVLRMPRTPEAGFDEELGTSRGRP